MLRQNIVLTVQHFPAITGFTGYEHTAKNIGSRCGSRKLKRDSVCVCLIYISGNSCVFFN